MAGPDAAMLAGPGKVAQFLETRDPRVLEGVFSTAEDVTILENFPPHLFRGQDDLARWKTLMAAHVGGVGDLLHRFGEPQDSAGRGHGLLRAADAVDRRAGR
jgi:hypothetical protein